MSINKWWGDGGKLEQGKGKQEQNAKQPHLLLRKQRQQNVEFQGFYNTNIRLTSIRSNEFYFLGPQNSYIW